MSQRRRLEVELVGNTRGFEAALNRVNLGLTRTATGSRNVTRDMSLWERQMLAIGTTARYALAGALVFGITGAIQKLGEFNKALGEVAALAGDIDRTGRYQPVAGGFLGTVGDEAILLSNKLGIAVGDIQQYMTRFFSAFEFTGTEQQKLDSMRGFVDEVGRLQAMLGREAGDPQQLAGGIAGMVGAMPGGRQNAGRAANQVANWVSFMLQRTPNVTGRDISRDIGRMQSVMAVANMTPQEVFATWGLAGQAGGSASVLGRGIEQLLGRSVMRPQTPDQKQAFMAAGLPIDPTTLRNFTYKGRTGGMAVLMRMMESVAGPGGAAVARPGILGMEDIDDETALATAGVTGINTTQLYKLLGRAESVRQFINLMSQGGVPALEDYIDSQEKATKSDAARDREREALHQLWIQQFNEARRNLGLSMVRGIAWPLHQATRPIVAASNLAVEHPVGMQVAMGTGASLMAARALQRLFRARAVMTGVRGLRPPGKAGQISDVVSDLAGGMTRAGLIAEATPSILAGGPVDGSRGNPFWVIIHPATRALGSVMNTEAVGGGTGGGGTTIIPPVGRWGRRFGRLARGLGVGALVTLPMWAEDAYQWALKREGGREVPPNHPLLQRYAQAAHATGISRRRTDEAGMDIASAFASGRLPADRAEALLRALSTQRGQQVADVQVSGMTGSLDVKVRLLDKQGREIGVQQEDGVPVKWWGASPKYPTTQGKPGSAKGGR